MTLMLITLGVISLLELALFYTFLWRWQKIVACIIVLLVSVLSGLLLGEHGSLWTTLLLFFSIFRLINLLRVIKNRIYTTYLRTVSARTSVVLISCQLAIVFLVYTNHKFSSLPTILWYVGLFLQCLASAVIIISVNRHMRTTNPPSKIHKLADTALPTLTIAIPARNETEDLNDCLRSLTGSNYPKLEILVLDDCSQEKRTPEIIRKFAHDGVRFMAGKIPPDRWLAKNYAYEQLVKESNGEFILFCGVDVRFSPNSLRLLVESLLMKNKMMMSVMPSNNVPKKMAFVGKLVQPSRYAWELALPRRQLNRPPVLSTCWIIQRKALDNFGGFDAVSHSISPESYFARKSIKYDQYSFLKNNNIFGISCDKSVPEQLATAIRTRYPQLHKRIELTGLVTLIELTVLVLPYVFFIIGLAERNILLFIVSTFNCTLLGTFYTRVVNATYQQRVWFSFLLLPLATLLDLGLLNYSMWQYEFNEVIWKNRNVCIPIMQTYNSLPKLP